MHGQRPTHIEIDLNALVYNFRQIRRQAAARRILAVVKADAYGHGARPVASALQTAGAECFGVAIIEEGVDLRQAGISRPILVLGGIHPGQEDDLLGHGLTPVLYDLQAVRRLNERARGAGKVCPWHLKIDTGMARVGFRPEELPDILPEISRLEALRLEGVLSHFALADEPEHPFSDVQVGLFRNALAQVRAAGLSPTLVHAANSAALFTRDIPECNMVRPGIALYGALPSAAFAGRLDLRPVMRFATRIAQVKSIPVGTGVSYGHRFRADRPTVLAAIPVGYADGLSRHLSGKGEVLVRGRRAKIAGTVCMDWTLLDVTDIAGVAVGDQVTLLGRDEGDAVSAEEWAETVGSISYEVFCQLSKRVPRIYKGTETGISEE